jgi:hypothetical protein
MRDINRRRIAACCFALALALPGCNDDDDGTAPGQQGFAGAIVTDDPTSTSPSASGPLFGASGTSGAALYSGSISGDVAVAISANGTTWIELGPPEAVSLAAQAASTIAIHTDAAVPAGTYNRVRLRLQDASVEVLAGSSIGGITIVTDVAVLVGGGGDVEIIMTVPDFEVSADATVRTEVFLDLNSELWITEDAVQTGTASEGDIEAAIEGDVRAVARSQ